MLRRLKEAAMILIGYRPAEVRFDEEEQAFARDISDGWAHQLAITGRLADGRLTGEEIRKVIQGAIANYATYLGPPLWTRWRPRFNWRDEDRDIPF